MGDKNDLSGNFWHDWGIGSDKDALGPSGYNAPAARPGKQHTGDNGLLNPNRRKLAVGAGVVAAALIFVPTLRDGVGNMAASSINYIKAGLGQASLTANKPDPVASAVLFPTKADPNKKISIATIEIMSGHVRQQVDSKTKATNLYEVGVKITVDPQKFSQVSSIDPAKVGQNQYLPYLRSFHDPMMTEQCFADFDQAALTAKSHPELWLPKENGNTQPQKEFKNAEVLYMVKPYTDVPDNPGKVNIVVALVNGNSNLNLTNPKATC